MKKDPSYLLGQLTGLVLLGGVTAAVAAAARRAWRRNAAAPEQPGDVPMPVWRTLYGEIVERRDGEILVDDGVSPIRFTTVDVPVMDAGTGQQVAGLPECGPVVVIYDLNAPMGLSLPPLCTGAVSILLNPTPADMVPLRASAVEKGYEVSWRGFQTPIILTKNDITLKLQLDSDRFTYIHRTRDLQPLDRIERLSRPVRLDGSVLMVPADLIAALV